MFISFEGVAGSGKTTQVELLYKYISDNQSREVVITAAYEADRRNKVDYFINSVGLINNDVAIMFLFQALHAVQYKETKLALDSNKIVIADRWRESFFAHHIYAKTFGDNHALLKDLDTLAFRDLEPDISIMLLVPAAIAYERYVLRENAVDDKGLVVMDLNYFLAIEKYYTQRAKDNNWFIINGARDPKEVFQDVIAIVKSAL